MTDIPTREEADEEIALVVRQPGEQQEAVFKFLNLMLSYLYGFNIRTVENIGDASPVLMKRAKHVRCVFVIQNEKVTKPTSLTALSLRGAIPVFLLVPQALVAYHQEISKDIKNIFLFAWENVSGRTDTSLREIVDDVFERNSIAGLFDGARHLSFRVLQQRVQRRLKNLNTLPTLPEIILRIMKLLNDPDSTAEDLEEVLLSDASIVHKLIQIVNTPIFAGAGHTGEWTLTEAIVRLGRKKIASMALQIKLINTLIKPEESKFDLRRFWLHSVGTAMVVDKICDEQMVHVENWDECENYWIAALLHDIGKLILGFFFWNYFEKVLGQMDGQARSFRDAETRMGDTATHEQVGELLLIRTNMSQELVSAVANHSDPEPLPRPLVSVVHLGDQICKDLGFGYIDGERGEYSDSVLRALDIDGAGLDELREKLRASVVDEIVEVVERCTAA
jgi:HD-like signal output (HDOD) protein